MRDLTIMKNGKVHGHVDNVSDGEEIVEELWMQGRNHTQLVDEAGNVITEFEV